MEKYKKTLTCSEQVDYLKMNKRVIYVDTSEDESKEFLYTHNYINTISPFKQFFCEMNEKHLPKKDQIRNCIMHSNSLTILLEYYNVKEKSFRKSSDRKAYQKIVKELLKLKKDNYF